jgi:hypothetical protein
MSSSEQVLAFGPPPLTQYAADCALGVIDFMAAVVRGVDLIDVTEEMRQIWRNYLAQYYPMLAPADRIWFASAPTTLAQMNAAWPQTPDYAREMWRQTWAVTLPPILQFIEPVLQAARQQQVWHLSHLDHAPQAGAPTYSAPPQQANPAPPVYQSQQIANNLAAFNNRMTFLTTNLMRSMSGH